MKILFEQIGSYRLQVVLQEVFQFDFLLLRQILSALEQTPSGLLENRLVSVSIHLPVLACANLVDSFVELGNNVESIQNVDGLSGLLGNHLQVRPSHI